MGREKDRAPLSERLRRILFTIRQAPEWFDSLRAAQVRSAETQDRLLERVAALERQLAGPPDEGAPGKNRLDRLADRLEKVESADEGYQRAFLEKLYTRGDLVGQLNTKLSSHPTVWGDPGRLDISPLASVFTCLFNTNSGRITVGDYTFAGSGVSLLAGSHDPQLKGFLRRDAEITEGCDIRIGRGVWLASGCTVLGPCVIGDNAVIAAGAVVVPGTEVPADTVYGGIPAKQIARLSFPDTPPEKDPAVLRALERNGGILFTEGWTPRENGILSCGGHWLRQEGRILVAGNRWRLLYHLRGGAPLSLEAEGSRGKKTFLLENREGETEMILPCGEAGVEAVTLRAGQEDLFLMLVRDGAAPERSREE